ncbi:MAG TPA: ATP-dependent RNA helicase HrpA [Acidimicrobiales bacterium]|nr:ATP-dependent RNA helicase HrpA [Acidimicrobiales bacterium]
MPVPADDQPGPGRRGRRRRNPSGPRGLRRPPIIDERTLERRRGLVPPVRYPDDLPVTARVDELVEAVRNHQVVIVAGETGSGKTTQLPKVCLQAGRGVAGMIGHTQPRRLAARTVAERIAEELDRPIGTVVGYTVRFTDQVSDDTLVKVMTDGILLAEIRRDPMLGRYDTIIVDEAHERSLNIDFLLGYLHRLLPQRPDLRVIITSATIDTERFARHFGRAPVVEVSGRSYPVEVRYRPPRPDEDGTPVDQVQAVCEAVAELRGEGPGDVLVFLSGEREIRDTAEALRASEPPGTEILPLYARLSSAEQHRVFSAHQGRRVVLATNVAETSLTVPGIRYVVDAGTARISRYSTRTKVQRLPIEPISQASANQRAGRCGRLGPGVCIRLYSEEDFADRPEFTDPEILRTNLASVILQMAAVGLGEVASFPFLDPPDRRAVRDGITLLEELGALESTDGEGGPRLTRIGRGLAQLPVDPRFARMVLEAGRLDCAHEVMIIAAALSIQDPRERPADKEQAAAEAHGRFRSPDSDFMSFVSLWHYLREAQRSLSSNQFRRLCRTEFLSYVRVREWHDVYSQLRSVAGDLGIRSSAAPAHPDQVHRALLTGLLSHIGMFDPVKKDYRGARNGRFWLWPGSGLARHPPRWVMVGELVETTRPWGRVAARIRPEWVEKAAPHLIRRTHGEPGWDPASGVVTVVERVHLFGLPIVAGRSVGLERIDREAARDIFLHRGLVEGDWDEVPDFFARNRQLIQSVEELGERTRRRDVAVDDETVWRFYDARVPTDVTSGPRFRRWWARAGKETPALLDLTWEDVAPDGTEVSPADYPDVWREGDFAAPLTYRFEPGADDDGVTAHVPLPLAERASGAGLDWQVPGFRVELVTALLRTLPKAVRRLVSPAPDHARRFTADRGPGGRLGDALAGYVTATAGVMVSPEDFDLAAVPPYLRVTVAVEDSRGRVLATGKDPAAVADLLRGHVRAAIARAAGHVERSGETAWVFGTLPRLVEPSVGGHRLAGYPALVDEGASVGVRVFATPEGQERAMWAGTVRLLLLLTVAPPARHLDRVLDRATKLALAHSPAGSAADVIRDCVAATVEALLAEEGGPVWDEERFAALRGSIASKLPERCAAVVRGAARVLSAASEIERRLDAIRAAALAEAVTDVSAQVAGLVAPGFVARAGVGRLADLERYLAAAGRRLDSLAASPARDAHRMRRLRNVEEAYETVVRRLPPERADEAAELRWMIEELRVTLFAQSLAGKGGASEERILRALAALGSPVG